MVFRENILGKCYENYSEDFSKKFSRKNGKGKKEKRFFVGEKKRKTKNEKKIKKKRKIKK